MTIPHAAVDAARQVLLDEGCLDREHYPGYRDAVVTTALEASMPVIQEDVTQRLARALFAVDSKHHFWVEEGVPKCLCGFVGNARARTQTEHITAAVLEEYTARIAKGENK